MVKIMDEWIESFVDTTIIALNVQELQGENPYEFLLYNIEEKERRNDGRLKEQWLKRYTHLDAGGWWCAGINLLTFNPSEWGCFKPYKPKIIEGKTIKYEHPPKTPTEVFALKIPYRIGLSIAQRYGLEDEYDTRLANIKDLESEDPFFWQWVTENPRVEVQITEGVKKAGCLLTAGYAAIGLPGVNSGYRTNTDPNTGVKTRELIPQLKVLCQHSRCFNFVFDADERWKTKIRVNRAIRETAKLIGEEGCLVSVATWDQKEGKGVDDIVAKHKGNFDKLHFILEESLIFDEWEETHDGVRYIKERSKLLDFVDVVFGDRLRFNELSQRVELDNNPVVLDDCLIDDIIRKYKVEADTSKLFGTIISTAHRNSYHPVQEYLKKCYEAGDFADIDTISTRYLKTSEPLYDYMVRQWLIGAVARAFKPGSTVQYALVLKQQREGTGKSKFFKVLGGKWFDDNFGSDFSTKALMSLHTTWIEEWAEIERISRGKELSIVKSFITRDEDNYVAQYARESLPHPRGFIFCGTTNEDTFLKSPTGDRRFLVIELDDNFRIDPKALAKERSAIWASAVREYLKGVERGEDAWNIPDELLKQVMESNRASRVIHPWEETIVSVVESKQLDLVNINWILDKVLEIPVKDRSTSNQKIVSEILTGLGWRPLKNPVLFSETNTRVRCWAAPNDKKEVSTEGAAHQTHPDTPQTHPSVQECTPEPERVSVGAAHQTHQNQETNPVSFSASSSDDLPSIETRIEKEKALLKEYKIKVGARVEYLNLITNRWVKTEVIEIEDNSDRHPNLGYFLKFKDGSAQPLNAIQRGEMRVVEDSPPWKLKEK